MDNAEKISLKSNPVDGGERSSLSADHDGLHGFAMAGAPPYSCRSCRGLPEDRAILEAAPQFAQLSEALGTRTVEAYKTALLIARKDANRTLDSLPIRMDECERRIAELADMDFEAAQAQQRTLVAREDAVRAELAGLASDTLVCQTQAEYQALLAEQKALEAENITYRNSQQVSDSRPALRAQLLQLENDLDHLRVQISRARTAMVQGQQRLESLKADKLAALQDGQKERCKRLMESLAELGRLRAKAETVLAARVYLEETRARLAELAGEKQRCDEKLRRTDQQIALCEEFTRYKVQFLTHTVNCRFELAQFCLFREQINGGLAECCEVMVNGVPYADLNHAMQVNVGVVSYAHCLRIMVCMCRWWWTMRNRSHSCKVSPRR